MLCVVLLVPGKERAHVMQRRKAAAVQPVQAVQSVQEAIATADCTVDSCRRRSWIRKNESRVPHTSDALG